MRQYGSKAFQSGKQTICSFMTQAILLSNHVGSQHPCLWIFQ